MLILKCVAKKTLLVNAHLYINVVHAQRREKSAENHAPIRNIVPKSDRKKLIPFIRNLIKHVDNSAKNLTKKKEHEVANTFPRSNYIEKFFFEIFV